jgi:hypothetical protein
MMSTAIGEVKVHESCEELEYHFNKSIGHDWCGPRVKIKSIALVLDMDVNACVHSKSDGITANVNFTVRAVVSDESGRIIERHISVRRLKEALSSDYGFSCGWHEGKNEIKLNDTGLALIKGVRTQTTSTR